MTDHLATAQRWLSTAQDSRSFDHLMSAMDQILAHLDAQNTPQEATSADLPASQPEPDQLGGDHPANGYTPTTDEVRDAYVDTGWAADGSLSDPRDPDEFNRWLAGIRAEVREQITSELIPVVAHKGRNDTDLSLLDEAAHKLEHGYSFGSNVTAAVVRLIRNAIRVARQEQP